MTIKAIIMKLLIDTQGVEFKVTDITFERVKYAFIKYDWRLLVKDIYGNIHFCIEIDNGILNQ